MLRENDTRLKPDEKPAHDKALGPNAPWSKDGARVTADALGRTEEAAALRERYGVTGPEKPQLS